MSQGPYVHALDWGVAAATVARELDQPSAVVLVPTMYVPRTQVAHHGQALAAEHGLLADRRYRSGSP